METTRTVTRAPAAILAPQLTNTVGGLLSRAGVSNQLDTGPAPGAPPALRPPAIRGVGVCRWPAHSRVLGCSASSLFSRSCALGLGLQGPAPWDGSLCAAQHWARWGHWACRFSQVQAQEHLRGGRTGRGRRFLPSLGGSVLFSKPQCSRMGAVILPEIPGAREPLRQVPVHLSRSLGCHWPLVSKTSSQTRCAPRARVF